MHQLSSPTVGSRIRVLVTGAGGFIGRFLVPELQRNLGNCVEVFTWQDRRQGDMRIRGVLEKALRDVEPDIVVHLAWSPTSSRDYASDPENAEWAQVGAHLANLARRQGMWVLFAGSAADELSEDSFDTPYGRAKCELRVEVSRSIDEGLSTWFRPQYVYSIPHGRPALLRQLYEVEDPGAFAPERPEDLRDWIDVRDVASGVAAILANGILGVVDVGSGKAHTVKQFLDAVRRGEVKTPSPADLQCWETAPQGADIRPLEDLGWTPSYTQALFARLGRS